MFVCCCNIIIKAGSRIAGNVSQAHFGFVRTKPCEREMGADPLILILPTVNCVLNAFSSFVMTFSSKSSTKFKMQKVKLDIKSHFEFS